MNAQASDVDPAEGGELWLRVPQEIQMQEFPSGKPVVDAEGLLTERNPEQAAQAEALAAQAAIPWEGPLPAPQTH